MNKRNGCLPKQKNVEGTLFRMPSAVARTLLSLAELNNVAFRVDHILQNRPTKTPSPSLRQQTTTVLLNAGTAPSSDPT
ncbi:hypothetical protein [Shimia sp.]|jgi:hypothetical protein|uniref:hypothetical protein n=1 Tax=unclassified Shimia TaxID=2630038 RepID=UPI0025F697FE|nr:hypothetical protein [Shimia sp.]